MTKAEHAYPLMLTEYPDILTAEQTAKILGIGRHQVYKMIDRGSCSGWNCPAPIKSQSCGSSNTESGRQADLSTVPDSQSAHSQRHIFFATLSSSAQGKETAVRTEKGDWNNESN